MSVKEYVLGFAFTLDKERVALIQKERPEWQKGRYNGIGGKCEPLEVPSDAMEREFMEETGVRIPAVKWDLRGTMGCEGLWRVSVFTVATESVWEVSTKTDERVLLILPDEIHPRMIENVPALIQLCKMDFDYSGSIPLFHLNYDGRTDGH